MLQDFADPGREIRGDRVRSETLKLRELPNGTLYVRKEGMGTKRAIQYWVIPPESDAEFVANMEDVLDVYSRPCDADIPVLCMDEHRARTPHVPLVRVRAIRVELASKT